MNTAWKKVKLKDIGSVITGNTPPRKNPEFYGNHTLFIKPTDIQEDVRYTKNPEECYSELGFKKYKNSLIPKGSTCVVTIGSIGKKMTQAHCDCFVNQAVNAVVPSKDYDENFVYYLLKYNLNQVKGLDSGTASGRENVSKTAFSNIEVSVPNALETQTQIANILSAYDDLIENNLRRIKLLEEMAEVYFLNEYLKNENVTKERVKLNTLVSFEIGGGWGEEEQNQEFNSPAFVIRGTDINNITTGKIENIPFRFHKKSNLSSRKLQHGDIIFEVSGGSQTEGVGKTILITNDLLKQFNSDIMCASFCKLLRPAKIDYSYFLNLLLKYFRKCKLTEVYEIRSASNIVNYNWSAFLKNQDILLPSDDFLGNFNNFIAPINTQILNLSHQNRLLKESRDILLPRLMSGEVGV